MIEYQSDSRKYCCYILMIYILSSICPQYVVVAQLFDLMLMIYVLSSIRRQYVVATELIQPNANELSQTSKADYRLMLVSNGCYSYTLLVLTPLGRTDVSTHSVILNCTSNVLTLPLCIRPIPFRLNRWGMQVHF